MIFLSFSNACKFFFTIFLLFVFTSAALYSQTMIKEKVIINPTVKSSHLSKSAVEYSPIIFGFGGQMSFTYSISGPGGSGVAGSNAGAGAPATEVSLPAVNGEYHVTVTSSCECNTNVGYYVVWQDPYGSTQWIAGYEMWFYGPGVSRDTFTFNRIPDPIPFDFSILLRDPIVYGTQESVINFWYKGDDVTDKSVTLSFANSDPDVIFYDQYLQQNIGNTLTTTLDNSYNFSVKSNLVNISYPKHITVIAMSNGLQRSDTLMIKQPNSVRAYFEKPNLSPGDTVNIIVKKVDNQFGWESNYPDTTHFEVGIKNGCGLGLILDMNGEKKDYFRSIQQPIRFVVADSLTANADSVVLKVGAPVIPEGNIIVGAVTTTGNFLQKNKNGLNLNMKAALSVNKKILAKAVDETSCTMYTPIYTNTSDAEAGIDQPTIKITLTGSPEIWPYLPDQIKYNYSRGADRPGYNPYTSLKVQVTKGISPLPNTNVKITIIRKEGTGGHDPINHPSLALNKCGRLNSYDNPHTFTTDNNGEILIQQLRSSEVSGLYTIKAVLESNSNINDTTSIIVRVPWLIDFRNILSNNWVLVQHRPGHPSNHWCNEEMSYLVSSAMMDFYDWNVGYSKKKNKAPIILAVNDMSLIWGGAYEYMSDWNTGSMHSFHRVGLSVDIDRNGSGLSRFEETQLTTYMGLYGGVKYPEEKIHYGFLGGH